MKALSLVAALAVFASATARAEVTCTEQQLTPIFKEALAHFKRVDKANISLSTSFRDVHDIQPPYSATAISTILFDEKVGVVKGDVARKLWVIRTEPRPVLVTDEQVNVLKDNFDKTLASAPSDMRELLTSLKNSDFKNVAEVDAKMNRQVLEKDAPFLLTFNLENRLRAAKTCADFQYTLKTYIDAADVLISQQSQRFAGTRNLDIKMPFKGNGTSMAETLGEVCAKTGRSRLGAWKKAQYEANQRGEGSASDAKLWGQYFLVSSTTNWEDQWALTLGMIDKMLIKSKNQAAVKALNGSDRSVKDGSADRLDAKISELCPDLVETENSVVANISAIDSILNDWIAAGK